MIPSTALDEAIHTYNAYRRPMATAELVDSRPDGFTVRFAGSYGRTCCDYDYFEDLIYELPAVGVDIVPIAITDIDCEFWGSETSCRRRSSCSPISPRSGAAPPSASSRPG